MEPLEIFDSVNNKHLKVYVKLDVANRCRTDNLFAQDLFNKLKEQNVEDGSTVEIEAIKTELEEEFGEEIQEPVEEEKIDKDFWTRRETLKLIKVYQENKDKFKLYTRKKTWALVATQLSKLKVYKTPQRCYAKWKNLLRTYKCYDGTTRAPTRFQFFQEINDVFNNIELQISDTDTEDENENKSKAESWQIPVITYDTPDDSEKEVWSRFETLQFLKAYQKHKKSRLNFTKEKQFWSLISAELAKVNIHKAYHKCANKWKNLSRTYKKIAEKGIAPPRFQYFKEIDDIVKDTQLSESRIENKVADIFSSKLLHNQFEGSRIGRQGRTYDDVDFETVLNPEQFKTFLEEAENNNSSLYYPKDVIIWSEEETRKLIKAYKKHKHRFRKCSSKTHVWTIIASELAKYDVNKNAEKCVNKWKSLLRSYKNVSHRKTSEACPTFYFFEEMDGALKDSSLSNHSTETTDNEPVPPIGFEYNSFAENAGADASIKFLDHPDNANIEEKDDTENMSYEEIIIETEAEQPEEAVDTKLWSYNETLALIRAYNNQRKNFKIVKKKFWEFISTELISQNILKPPNDCEKKWEKLITLYKIYKLNKVDRGRFSFYKEIDEIFKDDKMSEFQNVEGNLNLYGKKCKCLYKKMQDRQTRHIERMQMLKRKLDLEERKVNAFEDYVKHLKNSK